MRLVICALCALVAFASCSDSNQKAAGDSNTAMEKKDAAPDSHQKVSDDTIKVLEQMNAAVAKVTSTETAKAAGETLKKLAVEMKSVVERQKKLGEPAGELAAQLEKEYGPRLQKAMQDMMGNMAKLMEHPELAAAFEEFQKAMPK